MSKRIIFAFKDSSGNATSANLDASGNLKVTGGGGGGGAVTVADGDDTVEGALADAAITTNAAGTISGKLRGLVALLAQAFTLGNPLRVDPTGTTTQPVSGSVSQTPTTSGGLSISRVLSAATTNATSAKGSAGQVYGWVITNTNAAVCYVKLYNKATAPTVGTDTPVMTLAVPGNAAGAGMIAAEFTSGIAFGTGIGFAITTGAADSDTGAVAANEVLVNLLYK